MKKPFDGTLEVERAPRALTGREIWEQVRDKHVKFEKPFEKEIPVGIWKKKSIFWDLPY